MNQASIYSNSVFAARAMHCMSMDWKHTTRVVWVWLIWDQKGFLRKFPTYSLCDHNRRKWLTLVETNAHQNQDWSLQRYSCCNWRQQLFTLHPWCRCTATFEKLLSKLCDYLRRVNVRLQTSNQDKFVHICNNNNKKCYEYMCMCCKDRADDVCSVRLNWMFIRVQRFCPRLILLSTTGIRVHNVLLKSPQGYRLK